MSVECGHCGGPVYMETCPVEGHDCAVASECQQCGERNAADGCLDCREDRMRAPMSAERLASLRKLGHEWENDVRTVTHQEYLWARDLLEVIAELDRLRSENAALRAALADEVRARHTLAWFMGFADDAMCVGCNWRPDDRSDRTVQTAEHARHQANRVADRLAPFGGGAE